MNKVSIMWCILDGLHDGRGVPPERQDRAGGMEEKAASEILPEWEGVVGLGSRGHVRLIFVGGSEILGESAFDGVRVHRDVHGCHDTCAWTGRLTDRA